MQTDVRPPCPSCLRAHYQGAIRVEAIQPLPEGVMAPLLRATNEPCCHDCQSTDALLAFTGLPTWNMARTAVGNDRQEQYRLPGAPMGLVYSGLMRPNAEGDLERQHAWLKAVGLGPVIYDGEDDD